MLSATRLVLVAGLAVAPCGAAVADWERGKAALDAGDYVAAEVEFRAEVAARPGWAGGHYMLGETLRRARHFEEAVESLSKAVELEGANPTYCLGLGQGLVSATKFDEAVEVLGGLDPTTLEAGQRRTRAILLASAELSRDRHAAALAALEPELASGADDASLQRLLGHSLAGVERRGEALTAFERAFELNPRDVGSARQAIALALGLAAEAGDDGARTALNLRAAGIAESLAGVETTSANFELAARCLLTAREAGRALPWVEMALAVRRMTPGCSTSPAGPSAAWVVPTTRLAGCARPSTTIPTRSRNAASMTSWRGSLRGGSSSTRPSGSTSWRVTLTGRGSSRRSLPG